MAGEKLSIVEFFDEHEGHRCGYCKNPEGNFSHGMWAHEMTPSDYQDLIDRGWRRSGKYCYKPSMSIMCCPSYTIKCEANEFKLSKSQKKVLKNFSKFLSTGDKKSSSGEIAGNDVNENLEVPETVAEPDITMPIRANQGDTSGPLETPMKTSDENVNQTKNKSGKNEPKKGIGADPNKPKPMKAKLLRKAKRLEKMSQKGELQQVGEETKNKQEPKVLEEFISESETLTNPQVKFEIKLVKSNPPSQEFEDTFQSSYELYKKYQMVIHNDPEDKVTKKQFKRFLCHSPLFPQDSGWESLPFGSYHQQYYLDGNLVAVGVIDILPYSVSSVYLYYDPAYHFLTLGTFSALREIYFTQQLSKKITSLKFYYMGFYIHSCPKMRYKGSYHPSYLLCPELYSWHPISDCVPKLDNSKFCRFNSDPDFIDRNKFDGNLAKVTVLYKGFPMKYEMYRSFNEHADDETIVKKYAELVGMSSQKVLLYRHSI